MYQVLQLSQFGSQDTEFSRNTGKVQAWDKRRASLKALFIERKRVRSGQDNGNVQQKVA